MAPGGGYVAPSAPPSPALLAEEAEATSWRNIFKNFDTYQLAARIVSDPVVNGEKATIKVEERIQYRQKRGDITITMNPRQVEYRLEKIGGKWHILPPG